MASTTQLTTTVCGTGFHINTLFLWETQCLMNTIIFRSISVKMTLFKQLNKLISIFDLIFITQKFYIQYIV